MRAFFHVGIPPVSCYSSTGSSGGRSHFFPQTRAQRPLTHTQTRFSAGLNNTMSTPSCVTIISNRKQIWTEWLVLQPNSLAQEHLSAYFFIFWHIFHYRNYILISGIHTTGPAYVDESKTHLDWDMERLFFLLTALFASSSIISAGKSIRTQFYIQYIVKRKENEKSVKQ